MGGTDGYSHCVPYSHAAKMVSAGDYSRPIFRPAICTDVMFTASGMSPDAGASATPCRACARLLRRGHWDRLPSWPIWDTILVQGRAIMAEIWPGSLEREVCAPPSAAFIDMCRTGVDWRIAIRRCGARSVIALGRASTRQQAAVILSVLPKEQHGAFRKGMVQASGNQ